MRHIANVSFGKDSLAMMLMLIEKRYPLDEVIFYDTGKEFQAIYNLRDKVKPLLESKGITFTQLEPDKPFDYRMFEVQTKSGKTGYGWCGGVCRWGTTYKVAALNKYGKGAFVYIGIAVDETERLNKDYGGLKLLPLAEWGMTESDCLDYCYANGYHWNENSVELYSILDRVSCWCCRNKNLRELKGIYRCLPDYWKKLENIQARLPEPMKGKGKSVFDLGKRFESELLSERGANMNIQKIKTELLNPAAYNPRKDLKPGDKEYEKLKRSITEFGYVEPVIWNKATGNVVGGHQRLKVLLEVGHTEIDCVVVELEPQKEKALNVALNKIQGDWDETKLAELMADLDSSTFDIELTGFDAAEIDALLSPKGAAEDNFDSEKAKKEIEEKGALTQCGDIWLLGNHRLMCGDSTNADDFARLMAGQRAKLCVTSPPYGVGKDYEQKGLEPWFDTMKPAIKNICRNADVVCYNIGDLLTTGSQFMEPTFAYSVQMFADCGFRPLWVRIWDKFRKAFSSSSPFHLSTLKPISDGEYIGAFAPSNSPEAQDAEIDASEYSFVSAFAGHGYKFVKRLSKQERREWGYSMLWRFPSVTERNHKALPVELPWRCIRMHSDKDDIVLEPFSESGATIVACEQTGRRCCAMELSPIYCDIAVKRWEDFTGEKAVRLGAEG